MDKIQKLLMFHGLDTEKVKIRTSHYLYYNNAGYVHGTKRGILDWIDKGKCVLHPIKQLNISYSELENIGFLKKVNLENTTEINLCRNKIKDISPLKGCNLAHITRLDLDGNKIEDASVLKDIEFNKLETLFLSSNPLLSVEFLFDFDVGLTYLELPGSFRDCYFSLCNRFVRCSMHFVGK